MGLHPVVGTTANPPQTEEEIQHAAGAVRDVAHAFLKALTPTPDCVENQLSQLPVPGPVVPEGIVKNVRDALQKLEEIAPSPVTVQTHHYQQETSSRPQSDSSQRKSCEADFTAHSNGLLRGGGQEDCEEGEASETGEAEVSCGIDLPLTAQDCSGNVTPIPTTGELEDLSEVQSCATQGTYVHLLLPSFCPKKNNFTIFEIFKITL